MLNLQTKFPALLTPELPAPGAPGIWKLFGRFFMEHFLGMIIFLIFTVAAVIYFCLNFKKYKHLLKGAVIGFFTGLIFIWHIIFTSRNDIFTWGIIQIAIGIAIIMVLLGLLIGWIVGKVKSKK